VNNYVYIIASLPTFNDTDRSCSGLDADAVIEGIREQLGESDLKTFDFFLKGYEAEELTADFYAKSQESRHSFVKDYFLFDLNVRNTKVEYLNKELGRAEGTDTVSIGELDDFDEREKVEEVLHSSDILERERGLDDIMWKKISELSALENFSLNLVLSAVAKIKIIDRWLKLDADAGRELFRKFVDEIRNSKNTI